MKLYQYTFINYGTGVDLQEFDVEEKPKTYNVTNGHWRKKIYKEEVSRVSGYGHNVVILPEKDFEKARGLYLEFLKKGIIAAEKSLENIKKYYQDVSNMEAVQ